MPTWTSIPAYQAEYDKLELDIQRRQREMGTAIAKAVLPEGYRAAAADLGGDPKVSGWRPWLELQVRSGDYGASITPTKYSAGPWTVAEYGRNSLAGPMPRRTRGGGVRVLRSGRTSMRSRRGRWNGVTAGKGTATDATARFEAKSGPVAEKQFRLVLNRHFPVR